MSLGGHGAANWGRSDEQGDEFISHSTNEKKVNLLYCIGSSDYLGWACGLQTFQIDIHGHFGMTWVLTRDSSWIADLICYFVNWLLQITYELRLGLNSSFFWGYRSHSHWDDILPFSYSSQEESTITRYYFIKERSPLTTLFSISEALSSTGMRVAVMIRARLLKV